MLARYIVMFSHTLFLFYSHCGRTTALRVIILSGVCVFAARYLFLAIQLFFRSVALLFWEHRRRRRQPAMASARTKASASACFTAASELRARQIGKCPRLPDREFEEAKADKAAGLDTLTVRLAKAHMELMTFYSVPDVPDGG